MDFTRLYRKGCSAYCLKWIALVTMVIDHLAASPLKGWVNARYRMLSREQLVILNQIYDWMRHIGRCAFPLFAFFLVEGFFRTNDRKRYMQRLFVAALVSEIPFDLANTGQWISWAKQNTLFELLLGLLLLQGYVWLEKKGRMVLPGQAALLLAACGLSACMHLDYSFRGLVLITVFYVLYQYRTAAAVAGYCAFLDSPWSFPAFLLIFLYNGSRGNGNQRWFYFFYPMHLLLLYMLLQFVLTVF